MDDKERQIQAEEQNALDHSRGGRGALNDGMADHDEGASMLGLDQKSPGILRIEAITKMWTKIDKVWFIVALLVLTYVRMTAATVLSTYQSIALNEFGEAQKAGMVRTVRQVLTSASLPITAKLSDYIGRGFMLNTTIIFWIIGAAVTATSTNLGSYLPGFLLYTLGHVAGNILNYALSIDTTTLRNRLFLQLCMIFPSIINVWAGGVIAESVVEGPGWRWGAGMWGIIIPPVSLGLYAVLIHGLLKARRARLLDQIPSAWNLVLSWRHWVHLFWVMDLVGLTFLAGALACILLPLSLGGSDAQKWATAQVITPLVIGVLLLPTFAFWEARWARHPIFPFHLMHDRHVMFLLIFQFLKNIATSARDSYLYFTLVVSFNQSIEGATRINQLESFASTLVVIPVAFIIRRYRMVKPIVCFGAVLVIVAQGLHIRYRGGYSKTELAGLVASEILEGIGSGMSSHPALVAMQAKLGHEHALLVTSCWAVASQAAGGIASAIAGAIWTNLLLGKLERGLESAGVADFKKVAAGIYKSPLNFVKANPPGSVPRDAVMFAYRDVMKTLSIVGMVAAVVALPFALFMENVRLDDRKNLVESDSDTEVDIIDGKADKARPLQN